LKVNERQLYRAKRKRYKMENDLGLRRGASWRKGLLMINGGPLRRGRCQVNGERWSAARFKKVRRAGLKGEEGRG